MIRPALVFSGLLLVAACATPLEQCLRDVTRELRVMDDLIEETRGNLERGYALTERQELQEIWDTCEVEDDEGNSFTVPCQRVVVLDRTERVAIDLVAEEAKLNSMLDRRADLVAEAQAGAEACRATYPEG